jgi:hypothetical protein
VCHCHRGGLAKSLWIPHIPNERLDLTGVTRGDLAELICGAQLVSDAVRPLVVGAGAESNHAVTLGAECIHCRCADAAGSAGDKGDAD